MDRCGYDITRRRRFRQRPGSLSPTVYEKVKRVCTENAGLTRALADVKVPFNPIAAYYIAPAKAKELSHTAGFASDLGPFGLIGPGLSLPEWRDLMAQ
jgi:hypothetical protein